MSDSGMGEYQESKKNATRRNIMNVLRDGEWHQYREIKAVAKTSGHTLSKHLKEIRWFLEKREGEQDFRTTYYRASPLLMLVFKVVDETNRSWTDIKENFRLTKNPVTALEDIGAVAVASMLCCLLLVKNLEVPNVESMRLFFEAFVWEEFETLSWNLVKETVKLGLTEADIMKSIDKVVKAGQLKFRNPLEVREEDK
jgi:hypothetical protein